MHTILWHVLESNLKSMTFPVVNRSDEKIVIFKNVSLISQATEQDIKDTPCVLVDFQNINYQYVGLSSEGEDNIQDYTIRLNVLINFNIYCDPLLGVAGSIRPKTDTGFILTVLDGFVLGMLGLRLAYGGYLNTSEPLTIENTNTITAIPIQELTPNSKYYHYAQLIGKTSIELTNAPFTRIEPPSKEFTDANYNLDEV